MQAAFWIAFGVFLCVGTVTAWRREKEAKRARESTLEQADAIQSEINVLRDRLVGPCSYCGETTLGTTCGSCGAPR
jgi:hypothetical protein